MTGDINNPWTKAYREHKKALRRAREQEAQERARREQEAQEQERLAQEAQEQARRKQEAQEQERREHEAQEQERREREAQEHARREQETQEVQKRQKREEEDKYQNKLKEIEEIKDILKNDFKNPYKEINFLKLLSNIQYLDSLDTQNIEHADILSINSLINSDKLADDLKNQITEQLPKIPGNCSAFILKIEEEYAAMVAHNSTEGMVIKFNDPRGKPIPDVLKQIIFSNLGTRPIDFCTCIDGPSDLTAIQTLLEFITAPNIIILIPENLTSKQNKLLRILDVLYSCDLIKSITVEEEANKFLDILYKAHTTKDIVTIEASARAILNYYSTCPDIEEFDGNLLNECQNILSDLPISAKCSSMIRSIMQELTQTPQEVTKIPIDDGDLVIVNPDLSEDVVKVSGLDSEIYDDYFETLAN